MCLLNAAGSLLGPLIRPNWVHLYADTVVGLVVLSFAMGPLLLLVWPADRKREQAPRGLWNGAVLAALGIGAISIAPLVSASLFQSAYPPGRTSGPVLVELWEAARYGFDGTIPRLMVPEHPQQVARGLGHPPR